MRGRTAAIGSVKRPSRLPADVQAAPGVVLSAEVCPVLVVI